MTIQTQEEQEQQILLSFIQGRAGSEWANKRKGWTFDESNKACTWEGIDCGNGEYIIGISLTNTSLTATIPHELGQLTMLKSLELANNNIHGPIPMSIFNLAHLEKIDLSKNRITGTIRAFASPVLKYLNLNENMLVGTLPSDIGDRHTQMTHLHIIRNKIAGTLPFSIQKMRVLNTLSLSENKLSGTIPSSLGDVASLNYLYLDNNIFQGTIPPKLARPGSALKELWLQENRISGTVPAAIADLPALFNFYIDGNKLTGTVPQELCDKQINADFFPDTQTNTNRDWCQSVACPMGYVAQQGVYPCTQCPQSFFNPYLGRVGLCIELNQRQILQTLYRDTAGEEWVGMTTPWEESNDYYCGFTGVTCDNKKNVIAIELKGKGLRGTIPEELGYLEYLEKLDLSDNYITGYIPSDLRWAPLEKFDIGGNQIRGIVPLMLCNRLGINGNGKNGDFGCDYIACEVGQFSPTGRRECQPCPDPNSKYLGSKGCNNVEYTYSASNASEKYTSTQIFFLSAFVFAMFAVFCFVVPKGYRRWRDGASNVRPGAVEVTQLSGASID